MQAGDNAKSLPMLERPGLPDSQRLPNAIAVINALKKTARVQARLQKVGLAGPPRRGKIPVQRSGFRNA